MAFDLNQTEIRVLGCLMEKQMTTPDYYPLTLSALVTACNQKSNRNPVMNVSESDVLDAVGGLEKHYLVREKQIPGARVKKYEHKLSGTLTQQYDFTSAQLAILAVLMLRGPQTPGEIRSRTNRMFDFDSLEAVDATLKELAEKFSDPYVKTLPREPGRREIRYSQLLSAVDDEVVNNETDKIIDTAYENAPEAIELLRQEVADMRKELNDLNDVVQSLIK